MRKRDKILILLAIFLTFFVGYGFGARGILVNTKTVQKIFVNDNLGKDVQVDFSLYWKVWDKINEKYVAEPDAKQSVYGAIKGMVASLKDPFSVYFTPDEAKKFFADLNGEFEGIGAELAIRDEKLTVVSPLENSPAEKVGLKPKDIILSIDDVDASTISFDEAIAKIRGEKGSEVKLLIQRERQEPFEVKITRSTIKIDSVKSELRPDKIMQIKIGQFSSKSDTTVKIEQALKTAQEARAQGIILDLRNNPGGLLDSAINIASMFIKNGVVVIEEGKAGKREEFRSTQNQIAGDIPLVVLVNGGSASAAEILAGAIKDSGRGKIVGEKTFGKGTVQDLVELPDGSNLKITIAHWLTPKGNQIDKVGIEPDEKVENSTDDIQAGRDPQFNRALKILLGN
ncbi:MAG: Uncharacterized protein CEN89_431 [Candidatus Berkelbacteria bacterium Licking1014_7]|uniref:PDZ domain-containing protein n=1 Tax=Candidatus Berkelbacteria bacterium Licking1014_7 TaxID=2017147 RepID=A0A554LJM9_9BACT|nr:MAG: Uncharacterized protein CEN89_431 [Candidatus Berkelbacteria bacterium Licking1014_7]